MTSADPMDLTGRWSGEFSYPGHLGPTTPFLATIEERGGALTGTVIEPDIVTGEPVLDAVILGIRHGRSVDFTKTYRPDASPEYQCPVDYVGALSADGNTVSGVWSLQDMNGAFEMRREAAIAEQETATVSEELPEPVTIR